MVTERPTSRHDMTKPQRHKKLPREVKVGRMEKFGRTLVPNAFRPGVGSDAIIAFCEYDQAMSEARPTLTWQSLFQYTPEIGPVSL